MKALKLLLLTLFAALGFAAQAQTIEVYKDGQVIDSFSAAQVDSVVYKQVAATPKYYYYVGTEEPTADNLATIGTLIGESISGYSKENPVINQKVSFTSRSKFWVCLPEGLSIYDEDGDITDGVFGGVYSSFTLNGIKYNNYYSLSEGRSITAFIY